ncbi:HD domain-containing phosphohydrolase, partial [Vibrio cholerae]|uniref:HD domain-containing phosphohydrolase n=1 Tax=Vibrio cholerae TaxID=666 RepID=UPI003CC66E50
RLRYIVGSLCHPCAHGVLLQYRARIMAIADVFEALTSNDLPYKKSNSLQECIAIMTDMATSWHIDPKLY